MDEREHFRIQMMGFLDDELSDEDRRAFVERCYADPELATELAQYRRLHDITDSMVLREPEDFEYERFFSRVAARVERRLGFVLLGVGTSVTVAFLLLELFFSDAKPMLKIGVGVGLLGATLLTQSVVRVWLKLRKLDRYQGVRR
ncbi:MAG: anti-sigma factor family protein [Planctomycetota bacterium JB042]